MDYKSLSVSEGTILGTKEAIEFRKKKIIEYIGEVEKKADFIQKNKNDLSVETPLGVDCIVPLVITSFPEFIWDTTEDLFLAEDLSRVMIPDEIKLLKKIDILDEIKKKPFVRYL